MSPEQAHIEEADHPPTSGKWRRQTTEDLYAAHWELARDLLQTYGVRWADLDDVSQTMWLNIHEHILDYDPRRGTARAWIVGFARRTAANARRSQRRRGVEVPDLAAHLTASGLDPEEAAIVSQDVRKAIRDAKQRETFILHEQYGLTIEEVAAAMNASESTVKWWLLMAKRNIEEEDGRKLGAFLGFGSMEALVEALRPKPRPFEEGAAGWDRLSEYIRQHPTPDAAAEQWDPPAIHDGAKDPPRGPANPGVSGRVITISKGKFALLMTGVFLGGVVSGVVGVLVWQARTERRAEMERDATSFDVVGPVERAPVTEAPPLPPSPSASLTVTPSQRTSASMAPAHTSQRMIQRIQAAISTGQFAEALRGTEEHARMFPAEDVGRREALRAQALQGLGRLSEGNNGDSLR